MVQLYFLYQLYESFCHLLVAFFPVHKIKPDPAITAQLWKIFYCH